MRNGKGLSIKHKPLPDVWRIMVDGVVVATVQTGRDGRRKKVTYLKTYNGAMLEKACNSSANADN